MRNVSSRETARDWAYSDQFLEHAKQIIGQHLLVAAPMEIDCKEATDLILLVSGRGDVAFRARRPANLEKYAYDITFRAHRDGFEKTELDKILDGKALWMLYGFGGADGKTLIRWVLIDLNALRGAICRGQLKRTKKIPNGDGTFFEAYDTRILKGIDASIIFAASEEIPTTVLPPEQRESTRNFWKRKIQDSHEAQS
jgi:hypothetical protein